MPQYRETAQIAVDHPTWPAPQEIAEANTFVPGRGFMELVFLVFWPPVAGLVIGLSAGILYEDIGFYIKRGLVFGLLTGGILSMLWLLWITGFSRMSTQKSNHHSPRQQVMTYHVQEPDDIRIVPVYGTARFIDGVPEEDLRYFVENLEVRGHTQRSWLGERMPSGTVVDAHYWGKLSKPLRKVGIIRNVSARRAGILTTHNALVIKELLDL